MDPEYLELFSSTVDRQILVDHYPVWLNLGTRRLVLNLAVEAKGDIEKIFAKYPQLINQVREQLSWVLYCNKALKITDSLKKGLYSKQYLGGIYGLFADRITDFENCYGVKIMIAPKYEMVCQILNTVYGNWNGGIINPTEDGEIV
jgi:hypothetical protein